MKRFLTIAFLGLAVLGLAACGGSDNPSVSRMDMTQKETCEAKGSGYTFSDNVCHAPPSDTAAAVALKAAVDEERKAAQSKNEANQLLKAATEAADAALSASKVKGSSQMAYDNAMTVLGTGAKIEAERMNAAAAVAAIEAIDTSDMSDAEKKRIANILADAKADLTAIVAIQQAKGAGSLDAAEMAVKAGQSVDATDAKIAMARADAVADAIKAAIDPATGGIPVVSATTGAPTGAVTHVGVAGMTFAQIAGSPRKAATTTKDFKADAAGADLSSLTAAEDAPQVAYYKGIGGKLFCLSGACSAAADGKITGTVLFVPDAPDARWIRTTVGGNYEELTNAASYGYWLAAGNNAITLHANSLSTELVWARDGDATKDVTASYTGDAMGYSYREQGEGDNKSKASGEFTADVTLKATFKANAASSTLSGTISGFESTGNAAHVNPAWRVTLGEVTGLSRTIISGVVLNGSAHGDQHASNGDWTAHGYGAKEKNPTGFVGAFDADFKDGEATGVFHAD